MGIEIRWENEFGKQLARIPDPKNYFGLALTLMPLDTTVCLRFIDLYGTTVFNQEQIAVFISELQVLKQFITPDRVSNLHEQRKVRYQVFNLPPQTETRSAAGISEHISRILELANRSNGQVHTYLKFYGD